MAAKSSNIKKLVISNMVYTSTFCMWWRGAREVIKTWRGNPIKTSSGKEHIFSHLPPRPQPPFYQRRAAKSTTSPQLPSPSWPLTRQGRDRGRTYGGWPAHPQNMFYPSPPEAHLLYSFPKTFSTAFRQPSLQLSEKFPKIFQKVSEKFPKSLRKVSEKFSETFRKLFGNLSETLRKVFGNFLETFRKLFGKL